MEFEAVADRLGSSATAVATYYYRNRWEGMAGDGLWLSLRNTASPP